MFGRIESPNTSSREIELNLSYSGQVHPNRHSTDPMYENKEPVPVTTLECVNNNAVTKIELSIKCEPWAITFQTVIARG